MIPELTTRMVRSLRIYFIVTLVSSASYSVIFTSGSENISYVNVPGQYRALFLRGGDDRVLSPSAEASTEEAGEEKISVAFIDASRTNKEIKVKNGNDGMKHERSDVTNVKQTSRSSGNTDSLDSSMTDETSSRSLEEERDEIRTEDHSPDRIGSVGAMSIIKNKLERIKGIQSDIQYLSKGKIERIKGIQSDFHEILKEKLTLISSSGFSRILSDHLFQLGHQLGHLLGLFCERESDVMRYLVVLSFTLLGSSVGFHSFLYFVSVGYGLAVGMTSTFLLAGYNWKSPHPIPTLSNFHTALTVAWALRLVVFLLHREYVGWPQWHKKLCEVNKRSQSESKFGVWVTCGLFYATMITPCLNRLQAAANGDSVASNWGVIGVYGITLQCLGLLLETVADAQKSAFKSRKGNRYNWCNVGLWKFSSHPNYLGEVMFWSGTYLGGIACNSRKRDWLITSIGLIFVMFVMKQAHDSLSSKQLRRYGQDLEFLEFRRTHGFFGPFHISQQATARLPL